MTVAVIRDLLGQNDEWSLLLLYYVCFFFTYRKYTNFFLLIVLFQSSVRYNRFTCDYLLSSRV